MMHNGFGQYGNWLCGPGAFFPGPLGWIITILFWGLLIYLAVKLFQAFFSSGVSGSTARLNTLKERYARGEISEEEYHRMKTELM
ncbi:MAG TPA: SHOCT domain-containing protein [Desulfobulbus sp.]|nr:SHOCT domain-containing protein [Desulfobulbus sp.]